MPYRREKKTLPNGKAIGAEEDALQDRGKQRFVEVNRHWRRCPTGERETRLFKVVGVEEDALQKRAKHSILALKKMPHRRGRNTCGWN